MSECLVRYAAGRDNDKMLAVDQKPKMHRMAASPTTDIPHVMTDDETYLHECYEFGEKLGEGSFGIVYVVEHRQTGQRYACKTIIKEKVRLDDKKNEARFTNPVQLSRLFKNDVIF
jgi:serine/threonine protein kinase